MGNERAVSWPPLNTAPSSWDIGSSQLHFRNSMKIHGDMISPFVRMCVVTAHETGLGDKVALAEARAAPTEANPQLVALSPIAKIPVLVTDHGHPIHDSRVIIEYLC